VQSSRAELRSLVVSDGGAPNAVQRKQLSAVVDGKPMRSAVLTTVLSNSIKRGIATAISWTNPQFGFYRPEQVYDALDQVGAGTHTGRIWHELRRLQRELPENPTLALVAKALRPQDLRQPDP
jgi:hypothetical protein